MGNFINIDLIDESAYVTTHSYLEINISDSSYMDYMKLTVFHRTNILSFPFSSKPMLIKQIQKFV